MLPSAKFDRPQDLLSCVNAPKKAQVTVSGPQSKRPRALACSSRRDPGQTLSSRKTRAGSPLRRGCVMYVSIAREGPSFDSPGDYGSAARVTPWIWDVDLIVRWVNGAISLRLITRSMLRVEERMAEIAFEMAAADRHPVRGAAFASTISPGTSNCRLSSGRPCGK